MRGGKREGAGRPHGSRTKNRGQTYPLGSLCSAMEAFTSLPDESAQFRIMRRAVVALAATGAELVEIACVLEITLGELARRFRGEFDTGKRHKVAATQYALFAASSRRGPGLCEAAVNDFLRERREAADKGGK